MILMDDSANQYPLLLQDNQSSIEATAANAQFVAAALLAFRNCR